MESAGARSRISEKPVTSAFGKFPSHLSLAHALVAKVCEKNDIFYDDDMIQYVAIALWQKNGNLRRLSKSSLWYFVRNRLFDRYRQQKGREGYAKNVFLSKLVSNVEKHTTALTSEALEPLDRLIGDEEAARIHAIIPVEYREILRLRLRGLTMKEIGTHIHRTESRVSQKIKEIGLAVRAAGFGD